VSPQPLVVRGARAAETPDADPASRPARGRRVEPARRSGVRGRLDAAGRALASRTQRVRGAIGGGVRRLVDFGTPYVRAARRKLAPLTEMVSALGWIVLSGAVVLGLLGWSRGWLEFRTLALLLAIVALAGVAFTLGRWEYSAEVALASRRVRIGEAALGRVEVRNAARRATASSRIELPVGRNVASFRVPRLGPSDAHEEVFQVPTRRRGVITVGPVQSVRADPLGLVRRQRSWTEPIELFVHPDTVLLDLPVTGLLRDVEGVATNNLSSSDVSFHALREYQPGDDRRSIHWRTTARVGKLMVRQFEETMRAHLLLILSLDAGDYTTEDDFELAVSSLASLGVAALRAERQVSVYTSDGRVDFPSAAGLLDALCRLQPRTRTKSLRELAAEAIREVPGASMVALIVGGTVEPATLRAAHVLLPAEASSVALRCGRDLTASRRKASDLLVLDVPSLADLRRGVGTLR
jgi:uncharacterized protein (DUF58 family)